MRRDLENIEAILMYCDGIIETSQMYAVIPHP